MNTAALLDAGGLVPIETQVDAGATEQIVARTYRHPALGERPVIRLASDRLGQAEDLAMELGRSARHFLPPFWEEAGRAFKDLGNQTYAGRALNKSLEAERVHALESDRARRRDVILEFVLSGCLSGNALSDYGNDLLTHYDPKEAFAISATCAYVGRAAAWPPGLQCPRISSS